MSSASASSAVTAPANAAAAAPAADPAVSPLYPVAPAPAPWNDVRYLLNRYCHDDPKKLNDFRQIELDALCEMVGAPVPCYDKADMLYSSPFLPARFPSEAHMAAMAKRAILVKGWFEIWGRGSSLEAALEMVRARRDSEAHLRRWADDETLVYDVRISVFGHTMPEEESVAARAATLAALGLKGLYRPNQNAGPVVKFFLFVDVGSIVINPSRSVRGVYICREVVDDSSRNTLEKDYRLNARAFIGPTSMPPNLSFIMANLGKVTRASTVLDPFVGTGSLLVSAGHFGATCIGADLDWKILHGKTRKGPVSVFDNFKQYKLRRPEILCADLSLNGWRAVGPQGLGRSAGFVDAIVCDPPYGVRAGARKLGRAEGKKDATAAAASASAPAEGEADASASFASPTDASAPAAASSSGSGRGGSGSGNHVPATQAYDVEDVIHDLLDLSAQILVLGGRLVYWLPTTSDFRNEDLPRHPCLRLVAVGEQLVRSHFSRRLIAMEKVREFTEAGRMHRRDKATDPPPKYANLKENILTLLEEGPDTNSLEFQSVHAAAAAAAAEAGGDASAAAAATAAPVDLSSAFGPRPMSIRSQKRLAKADSIRLLRAQVIAANGGVKPSKRERAAVRERIPTKKWEHEQREKNKQVQLERREKKQGEDVAMAPSVAATPSAKLAGPVIVTPAVLAAAAAAPLPAPAAAAPAASPPSPAITQPTKKARVDDASGDQQ